MTANSQLQIFTEQRNMLSAKPITHSKEAYDFLLAVWERDHEKMTPGYKLLLLDKEQRLINFRSLYLNKIDTYFHDARKVMAMAEQMNAQRFILAHNRHYGILVPNIAHLHFVNALKYAGEENEVLLFDYLLINDEGYYSYMENEFHLSAKPEPS